MARARGRFARLVCHGCNREWSSVVMHADADLLDLHELTAETCARCSATHNRPRRCAYAPETCTCASPHVQTHYSTADVRGVQVRADQRAAFYRMPDGTISVPSSNALDDPIAQFAASHGGMRDEAYHLSDLARLHAERRRPRSAFENDFNDFSDRALTLDYDQSTILAGDHYLHDQIRREDAEREKVYDRQRPDARIRVYYGSERYEEAKRRSGRS